MSLMGRALGTRASFVAAGQIDEVLSDGRVLLLDVRTALELAESGTIPGAVHIHLGELADRLDELPRDRPILTT
ncbi:MAG: rhodanese-like domain-containing protein [Acidobacteriota bacterium]|nr:rhodanese-like domain-containing protein [Gammaproteobacteria bacterium]MDE2971270.1 rhodanese-like domain-containing protein [Acidobacteriota bacterium]